MGKPGRIQPGLQRRQVQGGHLRIGHDHRPLLRQHRRQQRPGPRDQPLAHHHVVLGGRQRQRQPPRRPERADRIEHQRRGVVRAVVRTVHDHIRLGIDGMALFHQPAQHLGGIAGIQQRPVRPPRHPPQQDRQAGAQPHAHRIATNRRPRLGVHIRPAPGRQHQRIARQQPPDHPPLPVAERRLAIAGEDFRDGAAGRRLDLRIRIAERQAEPGRQPLADRGLSGPHQPDQHDAPPRHNVRQGEAFLQGGVACHDAGG